MNADYEQTDIFRRREVSRLTFHACYNGRVENSSHCRFIYRPRYGTGKGT